MRKRRLLGAIVLLLVLTSGPVMASSSATPTTIASPVGTLGTPQASPVSKVIDPAWQCDQLARYQREALSLLDNIDGADAAREVINSHDFTRIRPSTARTASDALDEWASDLEDMDDVPRAAQEYHDALTKTLGVVSAMMLSYASGGALALSPYTETSRELSSELEAASYRGLLRCGDQWTDVFGESVNPLS